MASAENGPRQLVKVPEPTRWVKSAFTLPREGSRIGDRRVAQVGGKQVEIRA
jgi:hypothetical protein